MNAKCNYDKDTCFCPQLIPFKTPARHANYYDQTFKDDLKSGHPKCAMGSAEMNNL